MTDRGGKRRAILQVVDRQADRLGSPVPVIHTCEGTGEVEKVEK
jgi:hypothetical protein